MLYLKINAEYERQILSRIGKVRKFEFFWLKKGVGLSYNYIEVLNRREEIENFMRKKCKTV